MAAAEDQLRRILESADDPGLVAECIKALSAIQMREQEILPFINSANATVQKAAITAIVMHGNEEGKREAIAYLLLMMAAEEVAERRKAAFILQELPDVSYKNEVRQLLEDNDREVMQAAFLASGKMQDEELLAIVLSRLNTNEKVVVEALYLAGESSLSLLKSFILSHQCSHQQTEKLIRLIGRIGGKKAHNVLLHLMDGLPGYPHIIIKTFYQSNYTKNAEQRFFFEDQVRNCLGYCASILYMQRLLLPYQPKYQLLISSLDLELVNLRDTLLYIFALLYDKEKIKNVRSAFKSGNKEAIANAMEIIEMTVRKDAAYHFNLIFEASDIDHKTYALRKLYPSSFFTTIENVLICILGTGDFKYNYWTKACSIYTSKKQHHFINGNLISRYTEAEHPMLSELAKSAV